MGKAHPAWRARICCSLHPNSCARSEADIRRCVWCESCGGVPKNWESLPGMVWHGPLAIPELSKLPAWWRFLSRCQQVLLQTLSAITGGKNEQKYMKKNLFVAAIETTKIQRNGKNQSYGVIPHIPFHRDQPHSGPGLEWAEPCPSPCLKKE